MTVDKPKRPRIKLGADPYERPRQRIFRRDGWRCQNCGSLRNLEVHHKRFRSQSGDDSEFNVITLCNACHANEHE
jgi:5-methylcytosine-specific restriction endonuclease McrA